LAQLNESSKKGFLDVLKNHGSALHRDLAVVVVDESHKVETWTGKR